MAVKPLYPGLYPMCFDAVDGELNTFKGGEVVTTTALAAAGTDQAAADVFDGYVLGGATVKRVAVTKNLTSGNRPLFLVDDGLTGYGTLLGSVVGGTAGVGGLHSPVALGPHSAAGSGKLTCWASPGLYAVSLDAVDTDPTTGLTVSNPTLTTGAALYATAEGVITPNSGEAFENKVIARFIDFSTTGSYGQASTSSEDLVSAKKLVWAVIEWAGTVA